MASVCDYEDAYTTVLLKICLVLWNYNFVVVVLRGEFSPPPIFYMLLYSTGNLGLFSLRRHKGANDKKCKSIVENVTLTNICFHYLYSEGPFKNCSECLFSLGDPDKFSFLYKTITTTWNRILSILLLVFPGLSLIRNSPSKYEALRLKDSSKFQHELNGVQHLWLFLMPEMAWL